MGKVKRLELWWQLYVTWLPERDVRNIRPMDFGSTEWTLIFDAIQQVKRLAYRNRMKPPYNGTAKDQIFFSVARVLRFIQVIQVLMYGSGRTFRWRQVSFILRSLLRRTSLPPLPHVTNLFEHPVAPGLASDYGTQLCVLTALYTEHLDVCNDTTRVSLCSEWWIERMWKYIEVA